MTKRFYESEYEKVIVELMENQLNYDYEFAPDLKRDYGDVVLFDVLESSLMRINKGVHVNAIKEAVRKITITELLDGVASNKEFHTYLTKGVKVTYFDGEDKHEIVKIIDFDNISNNEFLIMNQFTVIEIEHRIPDVVLFINGLPLVVIELKNPASDSADVNEAYNQVKNYMNVLPGLFRYNCFTVISDMVNSKVGTITSGEDRYSFWKSVDGFLEENKINYETLFLGMFEKERLLKIIKNYIFFKNDKGKDIKILAGYHQFFAVEKAIESTVKASNSDGKGGVVWHTQGSGKSFSMLFYTSKIIEYLKNPTVVIVTDRNDLDGQLYGTFSSAYEHLPEDPVQIGSREELGLCLRKRNAGGIFFSTMQKFEETTGLLSDRRNIVVIADEAHRSQYGLKAKYDSKTESIKYGMAHYIRQAFPNATYIGFTGTPIDSDDKSTIAVFGDYIDIYDMTQAVADGSTKPIYYESRVVNLKLNDKVLSDIDREYDEMAQYANDYDIEESKKDFANLNSLLGSDETITELCSDILHHYNDRKHIVEGKAMIVAYNRECAVKIYRKLIELNPSLEESVVVVTSITGKEPEGWKPVLGTKPQIKEKEIAFKDVNSKVKIAIVVDMWLTGFDVPCLDTMYLFKPMRGHNLMQTIARVNRVYKEKEGGLIVDYIGIAKALREAMKDFSDRDRKNYDPEKLIDEAYSEFQRRLGYCKSFFNGFDYSGFYGETGRDRAQAITGGINHILKNEDEKEGFIKEAIAMSKLSGLCLSMISDHEKIDLAYFEAVKASVRKVETTGKLDLKTINATIENLIHESIESDGVINVFEEGKEFSIFDEEYIHAIKNMKHKNLAVEVLRKLLEDEIKIFMKTNLVRSELFSERMQKVLNAYRNGQLTNVEVIEELQTMSKEIVQGYEEDKELGLTPEERAFYDAITKQKNVKDFYENETLIEMTKELTEMINKNRTIDWNKKEQSRSAMRRMVKRLLKKYKYPPDDAEKAIDIVIKQAEKIIDN